MRGTVPNSLMGMGIKPPERLQTRPHACQPAHALCMLGNSAPHTDHDPHPPTPTPPTPSSPASASAWAAARLCCRAAFAGGPCALWLALALGLRWSGAATSLPASPPFMRAGVSPFALPRFASGALPLGVGLVRGSRARLDEPCSWSSPEAAPEGPACV